MIEQFTACIDEYTLNQYASNNALRPMTDEERAWCIDEAIGAAEGYYNISGLAVMDDKTLANAVLNAWHMYAQSNCI